MSNSIITDATRRSQNGERVNWEKVKHDSIKDTVEIVSDMINSSLMDRTLFCDLMNREHRYLQNEFTHLCLAWLQHCGSNEYLFDGRNSFSHMIGKRTIKIVNEPWTEEERLIVRSY